MAMHTVLTRRLNLKVPIVAAPLGRGSTPGFIGALAREGSLGFAPFVHIPEANIREAAASYAQAAGGYDRFGMNLVLLGDQMRRLDLALAAGCKVVSMLRGDPGPYVRRAKAAGALVFWTARGPAEARLAVEAGADFILVQGREAGGHLTGEATLMTLLPAIADAVPGTPLVAAGGIADGRAMAAALALGACGVWLGTRFVASAESDCHDGHKHKVTDSGFADLVETTLFDGGWADSPHRVVRNSTYERWEQAGRAPAGQRPGEGESIGTFPDGRAMLRYNVTTPWATMNGSWEAGPLYAGQSAAVIREVLPVATILDRMMKEAQLAFSRCQQGLSTT
jgi:nitronate monooxygenase